MEPSMTDYSHRLKDIIDNDLKIKSSSKKLKIHISEYIERLTSNWVGMGDKVLKDRSVAMLYLDKIGTARGKFHPDANYVNETYSGGHELLTSFELMRLLSKVKNDGKLFPEATHLIEEWIDQESSMLSLVTLVLSFKDHVFKDFLPSNPLSASLVMKEAKDYIESGKGAPIDEKVLHLFSDHMVDHLSQMKPDDNVLWLPAGCIGHATSIGLSKAINENGEVFYKILHSNTGLGLMKMDGINSTMTEYSPISSSIIENSAFWKEFILTISQQTTMDPLKNMLAQLDSQPKFVKGQIRPQQIGSCTVKSIENQFKHFILSRASHPDKGFEIYKSIKSLMLSQSKVDFEGKINVHLEDMLMEKEIVRNRYLFWIEITKNEKKFEQLKEMYILSALDLAAASSSNASQATVETFELIEKSIKGKPPLRTLQILDKLTNNMANKVSQQELNEIRNKYSEFMTLEGVNYLGLRSLRLKEHISALLEENFDVLNAKKEIFKLINLISQHVLPTITSQQIKNELYVREMPHKDFVSLLKTYISYEKTDKTIEFVYQLFLDNRISKEDLVSILAHCREADKAIEFARELSLKSKIHYHDVNFMLFEMACCQPDPIKYVYNLLSEDQIMEYEVQSIVRDIVYNNTESLESVHELFLNDKLPKEDAACALSACISTGEINKSINFAYEIFLNDHTFLDDIVNVSFQETSHGPAFYKSFMNTHGFNVLEKLIKIEAADGYIEYMTGAIDNNLTDYNHIEQLLGTLNPSDKNYIYIEKLFSILKTKKQQLSA